MGSERWGPHAQHSCNWYWLGCGQCCCVSLAQRVECCAPSRCFCRSAAGQLEWGCELRRAERELCWCEQCCEQRGCECQCVWARDWRERAECCWSCGRERVRCERVAERQRACVPGCCWIWFWSDCGCVCWVAAGQRECCCELRCAERELCRGEQCCYLWFCVCECIWPRCLAVWLQCRSADRRQRCVRDLLDRREQCCCALRWWRWHRRRCVGVCESSGWQYVCCCEL